MSFQRKNWSDLKPGDIALFQKDAQYNYDKTSGVCYVSTEAALHHAFGNLTGVPPMNAIVGLCLKHTYDELGHALFVIKGKICACRGNFFLVVKKRANT